MKKYFTNVRFLAVWIMLFAGLSAFAQLSEVRKVGTFDKVSVGSGFDLFITQGDVVKLTVEGSSELVQSVVAVVEKGELKIYSKKGDAVWGREPAPKIFLTLKSIKAIEAGGGAKVYGKNSIKLESLKLTTGGGSDMIMDVNVNELKLNAGGGSTLTVKGKAILLEVKASGGCDLLAKELIADAVNVSSSGGSSVVVYAVKKIVADAGGGSMIEYYGAPAVKTISGSGGSQVDAK